MNMKKLIYTILGLAVLAGCDRNPIPCEPGGDRMMDVSISLQTKAGSPAPVVNSVRVLAFDNAGNCALNSYFGNNNGYEMTPASDGYIVDVTSPLTLTITADRKYDVYVVLNEANHILAGTESQLSSLLSAIEIGDSKTTFMTYYDSKVKYTPTPASGSEPAFIMSAYQQVTIGDGASEVPQKVEFYTSDTMSGRTMAQITVDKITSEPASGTAYSSPNVPKVFVLGVSLVNVPGENTWTLEDGELGHNFTEIDFGGANSSGYYSRLWEGTVRQKVTLPAIRDDYTDSLLYRTSMAEGDKTSWSFAHADAVVFHTTNKDAKKGYEAAAKGPGAIDNKYDKDKNDNSVKYLIENVFPGFFNRVPSVISETFYSKTATEISELVFGEGEVSDDYWTVNLGNSYYVPENVTSARESATCIKVRLAVASPELQIPNIPDTTFINKLPNPSVLLTKTDSTYCISNYDLKQEKLTVPKFEKGHYVYNKDGELQYVTLDKWVTNSFKENGHIINADDHSIEYPLQNATDAEKSVNNYHVYVDGFSKRTEGTGEVYMSNVLTDQTRRLDSVIWNIPGTTTGKGGASVPAAFIDLSIPVNSHQFGGDYSVRRNTRYTITLHVDQSTYDKLPTKSIVNDGAFGITATVKTEKINDYED